MRTSRLCLLAALAGAAVPAQGAASLQPLIHLHLIDSGCTELSSGFGADSCRRSIFLESDITVFRDGTGLALGTLQERVEGQPSGLATAQVRRGAITPQRMASLRAALASAKIGTNPGACNPRPSNPLFDFHYELIWYGQNFRHNVLSLSSEDTTLCSSDLRSLLQTLAEIGASLPIDE